jgi:hypothetical protein
VSSREDGQNVLGFLYECFRVGVVKHSVRHGYTRALTYTAIVSVKARPAVAREVAAVSMARAIIKADYAHARGQ